MQFAVVQVFLWLIFCMCNHNTTYQVMYSILNSVYKKSFYFQKSLLNLTFKKNEGQKLENLRWFPQIVNIASYILYDMFLLLSSLIFNLLEFILPTCEISTIGFVYTLVYNLAYVTQYEKIGFMCTKYTAPHYSIYLTFCESYRSSVSCLE